MRVPARHSGTNTQVRRIVPVRAGPTGAVGDGVPVDDPVGDVARGDRHPGGRRGRALRRLVPQRRRLPGAPRSVGVDPPVVLPDLRPPAGLVGERARRVVAVPPGSVPHLPRADLGPVPPRRGDHRRRLRPRRLGVARHAPDRRLLRAGGHRTQHRPHRVRAASARPCRSAPSGPGSGALLLVPGFLVVDHGAGHLVWALVGLAVGTVVLRRCCGPSIPTAATPRGHGRTALPLAGAVAGWARRAGPRRRRTGRLGPHLVRLPGRRCGPAGGDGRRRRRAVPLASPRRWSPGSSSPWQCPSAPPGDPPTMAPWVMPDRVRQADACSRRQVVVADPEVTYRTVIVDDHELLRAGTRQILEDASRIHRRRRGSRRRGRPPGGGRHRPGPGHRRHPPADRQRDRPRPPAGRRPPGSGGGDPQRLRRSRTTCGRPWRPA